MRNTAIFSNLRTTRQMNSFFGQGFLNAFPIQDDFKSAAEADNSDAIDPRVMKLLYDGSNKIGDQTIDNKPGVLWSIGANENYQHGDGTTNRVEQLRIHNWAKDIDFVKVVTNGTTFLCDLVASL